MENDMKNKIEELRKDYETINSNYEAINNLQREQRELLTLIIEQNRELMDWFVKNKVIFIDPTQTFQSPKGPILGYDEREGRLIVFDVKKEVIQMLDVDAPEYEPQNITLVKLVRDGHFVSAVNAIKYLIKQQKDIIEHQNELINDLKDDLDTARKEFDFGD